MTGPKGKVDSDKHNSTEKKSLFGIRESAGFFCNMWYCASLTCIHWPTHQFKRKPYSFSIFSVKKCILLFHAYFPAMKFLLFLPLSSLDLKKKKKKDVQTWFSSTPTLPVKTFHLWAAFDNLEGLQAFQVIRDLCQALDWGFFWNTFHCSLKHPQRSHYFIFYFIFFSKQHKS